MNRFRLGATITVALVIAVSGFIYVQSAHETHAAPAQRDVPRLEGKWIRYSPDFAKRSNVTVAPVTEGSLSPIVSVTGTVTFDPQRVAALGSRIAGRVRRVDKQEGDRVAAGDVICEIESAEVGNAQAGIVAARAKADAANANDERNRALTGYGIASARDAEIAHELAIVAKAELSAAEQRVRAMGASGGSNGLVVLTAPIAGKVVEVKVSRGQYVEPTFTVARVASLDRVWIALDVFERELGHIRTGDPVDISPQTNVGAALEGHVAQVGDVIDLETRSAPVRVVVDNDGSLRPGQSVVAKIHTKSTTASAILAPLEAVTSVDGKPTVFVAHDETSVEPRSVTLGPRDGSHVILASGVEPNERIVVSGVFSLKSEVFR
jgi:membrane fusion protein, heavy metal efflux system